MSKFENAYKTIGEVVQIIGLKSRKNNSIATHTIRYWEKEFKQIRPKILNGNRRYYDKKNIELLKKIHFFLKLDENLNNSIKVHGIKSKVLKISKILKDLKKNK